MKLIINKIIFLINTIKYVLIKRKIRNKIRSEIKKGCKILFKVDDNDEKIIYYVDDLDEYDDFFVEVFYQKIVNKLYVVKETHILSDIYFIEDPIEINQDNSDIVMDILMEKYKDNTLEKWYERRTKKRYKKTNSNSKDT